MSIKEIAHQLGLAASTVSEILHHPTRSSRYNAGTRSRVIAAANELGYRPNAAARSMTSGRFNVIGLVYIHHRPFLPIHLINGLMQGCESHRQRLQLTRVDDESIVTDTKRVPDILREQAVDGLLIEHLFEISPTVSAALATARLPVVWLNKNLPWDCVHPADRQDAVRATQTLLAAGHTRIAYLSPVTPHHHYSIVDRQNGYVDAMTAARLRPWIVGVQPDGDDRQFRGDGLARIRVLLSAPKQPTAVIAYDNFEALQVVQTAVGLGLEVPRQLSVIAFGHQPVSQYGIPISTFLIDFRGVGQEAVGMLMRKISKPGTPQSTVAVPAIEVVGDTVRPPVGPPLQAKRTRSQASAARKSVLPGR
jgi:LacI family transcriptional regulator